MASPASPEASEIRRRGRQRLIGALALVLLLVVFVPMVLDSEPRPTPPKPALDIPPRTNPPPLPAPVEPSAAAVTQSVTPAPDKGARGQAPAAAVAPASDKGARGQAPAAAQSPPKLEGFAVQVGAFRDADKLSQARARLATVAIPHYTERLESAGGDLTRLRAGPFATREAAEAALARIKRATLDGKVVSLP